MLEIDNGARLIIRTHSGVQQENFVAPIIANSLRKQANSFFRSITNLDNTYKPPGALDSARALKVAEAIQKSHMENGKWKIV